ncbi:unnamed protein product [Camellia sinensis]
MITMPILSCIFNTTKLHMDNISQFVTTKTKNVTLLDVVVPTILFVIGYVVWAFMSGTWRRKSRNPGVLTRSLSMGVLHGGELAVHRLVDYHDARGDGALWEENVEKQFDDLLDRELPNFKELQRSAGKLEMSGKEDKAVKKLDEAVKKARKEGKSHEAYEFEMLLVEMLIYKGDFEKALQCNCLEDQHITDARRPLYKAIIHILLDDQPKQVAQTHWKEFVKIRKDFLWRPTSQDNSHVHDVVSDFDKFEKVVKQLKKDIKEAQGNSAPKLQRENQLRLPSTTSSNQITT